MLRLDRVCFLYFILTALLRSHFICSFTHPSVTITFENGDLLGDVLYHKIDENDKGVFPDGDAVAVKFDFKGNFGFQSLAVIHL